MKSIRDVGLSTPVSRSWIDNCLQAFSAINDRDARVKFVNMYASNPMLNWL